jgi:hypothetical protein
MELINLRFLLSLKIIRFARVYFNFKLSASDRSDIHTAIKYRVLILSDNHHLSLAAATPLRLSAAILVYMFFFIANETKNTYSNIPADKLINITSSIPDINYADRNIEQ